MAEDDPSALSELTAVVVSAYVSNNKIASDELRALIASTHQALATAGQPAPSQPEMAKPDKAAVRKSIQPDHLVSFVDGRKYKSLKRHLSTHGMTGADYRERYGLPNDYPMVSANYSAQRSELAKRLGLGQKASSAGANKPAKSTGRRKTAATPQG